MSKIEELIERLCPNGVEYKTIGEVATYRRGSFPQPYTNSSFYGGDGAMPFVQVADIEDNGFKLKEKTKQTISKIAQPKSIYVPKGTVICSIQGTIGRVAITQFDSYIDRTIAIFESFKMEINKRFFAYCIELKFGIEKQFARGSTLKTITKEEFTKFRIPVPPLEVQCEIVHILDDFTLLSAELSAELEARKRQYCYYREKLFEFNNDGELKTMGELFPFIRNGFVGTIRPFFTDEKNGIRYLEGTNIHNGIISDNEMIYVTKEFHQRHKKNELKEDDILMVQSGHIGECAVVGKKYKGANCHALIIMSNGGKCLSKYIVHYFHTLKGFKALNPAITGGTIKHVLAGKIGKIKVPCPPIEEQTKIVNILDKLEKLCNDISEGLPAEIEARKKQYEYYRDRLLTFKELKVNE